MGVMTHSFIVFLAFMSLFKMASTYSHFGMERMPLGGSLFVLDRVDLFKRQEENMNLGSDCDIDTACTTTSYGCECRFADDSWISDSPTEEKPPEDTSPTEEKPPEVTSPTEEKPPEDPPPPPPPPPKNDPVDPPGKLHCEPSPSGKYKDSHKGKVMVAVEDFCIEHASSQDQDAAGLPISKTLFFWGVSKRVSQYDRGFGNQDDIYDLKVEVVQDCKTDDGKLNLANPVKDHECKDILLSAWQDCNDKGRGGSLVAGCLTHSIVTKF